MIDKIKELAGQTEDQVAENFTPYRVIADHVRAASFLIADGVVPGNIGRNYICRMIIRRAARFGTKLGLNDPFLAKVAEVTIDLYGKAFPELMKNKTSILDNLTREEKRFARTVETGLSYLEDVMNDMKISGAHVIDGKKAFELYASHGLPLELTRDIVRENGLEVVEDGFKRAMEEHRLQSGGGKAMGQMGGDQVELYRKVFSKLVQDNKLSESGIEYNPYQWLSATGEVLAIFTDGNEVQSVETDSPIEIIVPKTGFYIESGGQVADTGWIMAANGSWEIEITEAKRLAAGVIVHFGVVTRGTPKVGDAVKVNVDRERRMPSYHGRCGDECRFRLAGLPRERWVLEPLPCLS